VIHLKKREGGEGGLNITERISSRLSPPRIKTTGEKAPDALAKKMKWS
jgi:hypothetical protein